MKTFLKTTTSMTMVMMMALPQTALAQVACGDGEFPCALEDGTVAQSRIDLMEIRISRLEARRSELLGRVQQSDRGVAIDTTELDQELVVINRQLDKLTASLESERGREAAQAAQAQAEQAQAEQAAKARADAEAAEAQQAASEAAEQERLDAEARAAAQDAEKKIAAAKNAEAAAERSAAGRVETKPDEAQLAAELKAQQKAQRKAERAAEKERVATEQRQADQQAAIDAEAEAARQAQRERRQAQRAAERAKSQAATGGNENAAQVLRETLTTQDTRSSDEEFDTAATGNAAEVKKDDDKGLSNFEKALIVGLGAVVVGTVLKNGDEVKSRSGDRVVVEREGELRVLKNDDALLRRPGNDVRTETFDDGSTRTTVIKPDETRVVTIRGSDGTVLRRLRILPDGQEYTLFDDTQEEREITVSTLPAIETTNQVASVAGEDELRAALQAQSVARLGDAYSLRQIRDIRQVRVLAPEIELDAVRFASGSAAIQPEQARSLARIGNALRELIRDNPRAVLLVEGHTDAVGDATYNLALSDRRAETVALALTEYFGVPEENMIVQGYGESNLKIATLENEQANRRAVVRNITELLR